MPCQALRDRSAAACLLLVGWGMNRLTVDEVRAALPGLPELQPLLDHALRTSEADRSREWSGSGSLSTSGSRLVDISALRGAVDDIVAADQTRRLELLHRVAEALALLQGADRVGAAEALLSAAALEERADRPREAAAFADAAYSVARDGGSPRVSARALRRRARGRWSSGDHAAAEQDYVRALEACEALEDARGGAEAAIGAGNVLEEQGRWEDAERWYRRALQILDAAGEASAERWHALLNLHVTLRWRGAVDESIAALEDAEAEVVRLQDPSARPFLLNARGQLAVARGDFADAVGRLTEAMSVAKGARAVVTIRLNLAEALFAIGRPIDASEQIRTAEREAVIAGLPRKLPEAYRLLGRIAAAAGDPDAFVLFERALALIREHGLPELERALTLQAYAESERRLGSEDSARELDALADGVYRGLGIRHRRQEWGDVCAPPRLDHPMETGNDS